MNMTMWRMIPQELHGPVMACIRVHQIIRKPSKALKIGVRMRAEMERQPEMRGPVGR